MSLTSISIIVIIVQMDKQNNFFTFVKTIISFSIYMFELLEWNWNISFVWQMKLTAQQTFEYGHGYEYSMLCGSRNASAGSLVLSETGSLDRAKAAYERRKKSQAPEGESGTAQGRVEITRVNPDHLIEELLKSTNLEQHDDSAESEYKVEILL